VIKIASKIYMKDIIRPNIDGPFALIYCNRNIHVSRSRGSVVS
jgi:hypothetical protein